MKIGDKVKIKVSSQFFNQHEGIGEIIEINSHPDYMWGVSWKDSYHNDYRNSDLELIYLTQSQKLKIK